MRGGKEHLSFRWCIENDFMVYVVPDRYDPNGKAYKYFRVAVRKGGISSRGKDIHYEGVKTYTSKEVLGEVLHKSQEEAEAAAIELRIKLKERYGV